MKYVAPYPHLHRMKDRQGRTRYLLRVPNRKSVTIKGAYGSPAFHAAYHAAMAGADPIEKRAWVCRGKALSPLWPARISLRRPLLHHHRKAWHQRHVATGAS